MTDDSESSTTENDSGTAVESETLSGRRNLAGSKDERRQVANAASKDQDGSTAFDNRMEKAGGKETPDGNTVPSADSRSIPSSVDPDEPSSTGDGDDRGSDGGNSGQSDE